MIDKAGPLQRDTDPEILFEGLLFVQRRHGNNKGFARDPETGKYLGEEYGDLHMGYSWWYRCVEMPRLQQVIHIMHPLCGDWLEWWVDGEKCIDAGEAIARLNAPALLTLAEWYALERIGETPVDRGEALNRIAGAANPRPNFISDRWSLASQLIDRLVDKNFLHYVEQELVRT